MEAGSGYKTLLWENKFPILIFFGLFCLAVWHVGWRNYVWMWKLMLPVLLISLAFRAYMFYQARQLAGEGGAHDGFYDDV